MQQIMKMNVNVKKTPPVPKDLTSPKHHRRIMCFDTETSGLIPRRRPGEPFPPDSAYPYIMQISWIIYDIYDNKIEEIVNEYVRIPKTVEVSPESTKVHGITREIVDAKGKPITHILAKFFVAYMKCDCIVAHNLQFDSEVVRKEMWRNKRDLMTSIQNQERVNMMCGIFTKKYNEAYHIDTFCTMMNTIQLCGIEFAPKPVVLGSEAHGSEATAPVSEAHGSEAHGSEALGSEAHGSEATAPVSEASPVPVPLLPNDSIITETPNQTPIPVSNRKKFPRLNELYSTLFDSVLPSDLHNSIVDVLVCIRCFLKVRNLPEMTDTEFQLLVETYSRPETN